MLGNFFYEIVDMPVMKTFVTTLYLEIIATDSKKFASKAEQWLASQHLELVKTDALPNNMG